MHTVYPVQKRKFLMIIFSLILSINTLGTTRRERYSKREIKNGLIWIRGENKPYTGVLISYYEGDKIRCQIPYEDGLLNGARVVYYKSGTMKSKENYSEGKKEGPSVLYYENGKIMMEINYVDGKKDGEKIHYDKNGIEKNRSSYKNGRKKKSEFLEEDMEAKL